MSSVCDFCDVNERDARKLFERKREGKRPPAHICDECVMIALEIIRDADIKPITPTDEKE